MVKLENHKYQLPRYSKYTQELGEYLAPRVSLISSKQTSTADSGYKSADEKMSFIKTSMDLKTLDESLMANFTSKINETHIYPKFIDTSLKTPNRSKSRLNNRRISPQNEKDWSHQARALYMSPINEKKPKYKHLHNYQDDALMGILKDLSKNVN